MPLGKLPLPEPPKTYLPKLRELQQIASLTLNESSIAQLAKLLGKLNLSAAV